MSLHSGSSTSTPLRTTPANAVATVTGARQLVVAGAVVVGNDGTTGGLDAALSVARSNGSSTSTAGPPGNADGMSDLTSETGSDRSKRNGEKEEFALMKLYSSDDTIQEVTRGELSKLRVIVKDQIFRKMKFLPNEGYPLKFQRKEDAKFGSFDLPDLRLRKGPVFRILWCAEQYDKVKTVKSRVTYWKTYRSHIRRMIMTERSSRTQAVKDCVVQGMIIC